VQRKLFAYIEHVDSWLYQLLLHEIATGYATDASRLTVVPCGVHKFLYDIALVVVSDASWSERVSLMGPASGWRRGIECRM
jgi:hypothetical protein